MIFLLPPRTEQTPAHRGLDHRKNRYLSRYCHGEVVGHLGGRISLTMPKLADIYSTIDDVEKPHGTNIRELASPLGIPAWGFEGGRVSRIRERGGPMPVREDGDS